MRKYLIILFLFTFHLNSIAQQLLSSRIDSLFQSLDTSNKFMGTLTMTKKGNLLISQSCGFRYISDSISYKNTDSTLYRIGSISKLYTAVIVFQLIQEKKLTLETRLSAFYPKIKNADKITIGQLLNHHSGIFDFSTDPRFKDWAGMSMSHDQIIKILEGYDSKDLPGKRAVYSNSNYVLLGFIVEKITKKSFADNLNSRIIKPLKLTHTTYSKPSNIIKGYANSFRLANGKWVKALESNLSMPSAAGAVQSSAADVCKVMENIFNLKLVNAESLMWMYSRTDGFGMGMFQFPFMDKKAWGHSGGIDANSSITAFFPEDSLIVTLCSNGQVYPINDVLLGVLSMYFNKPYTIPTFNKIAPDTFLLNQYIGNYSSVDIPVKVKVTRNGNTLMAQGSGKSSYPLEPTDLHKFIFTAGGIIMEFFPDKGGMILKQGGMIYYFTKNQ